MCPTPQGGAACADPKTVALVLEKTKGEHGEISEKHGNSGDWKDNFITEVMNKKKMIVLMMMDNRGM